MLDMILKNVWQRKTRSVLTVIGVAMAVMLFLFMYAIMHFYDADMEKRIAGFAGKVVVTGKSAGAQGFANEGSMMSMATAQAVLAETGIDRECSSASLYQELVAGGAPNMPPLVMAVGIEPGREQAFLGGCKIEGAPMLEGSNTVILGAKAASYYGKTIGQEVEIQGRLFCVAGLIEKSNEFLDSAVLMPLLTAQALFFREGVVSSVHLTAADPARVDMLAERLQTSYPDLGISAPADMARAAREMLVQQRMFFNGIEGTAIFVALIVITIVMVMAVAERKKEIGTLKAIGAKGRTIIGLIAGEAVLLSLTGGLLAVPIALSRLKDYTIGLDLKVCLTTLGLTVAVGVLASLWPAWRALRVDPLESLRYE